MSKVCLLPALSKYSNATSGAGTLQPLPTEPLGIPELNLSGLLPEQQNAVVKLDLALTAPAPGGGATADFTAWPEFHNGVAAGMAILQLALCPLDFH